MFFLFPPLGLKLREKIYKHVLLHCLQVTHFAAYHLLDMEICVTIRSRRTELCGVGEQTISLLSALAFLCTNTRKWKVGFLTQGNL